MNPLLGLLLALGALIGLFGQEAAYARSVSCVVAASRPAERDCMGQMKARPASKPCPGNALDCIAAMGCTIPLSLTEEHRLQVRRRELPLAPVWPRARPLVGVEVAPERHPPLSLG